MRFIEIQGFSVRLDKAVEFQKWVVDNQERITRAYPKGSEFGGNLCGRLQLRQGRRRFLLAGHP